MKKLIDKVKSLSLAKQEALLVLLSSEESTNPHACDVSVQQAADLLQVTRQTIHYMIRTGQIQARKVGNVYVIDSRTL